MMALISYKSICYENLLVKKNDLQQMHDQLQSALINEQAELFIRINV